MASSPQHLPAFIADDAAVAYLTFVQEEVKLTRRVSPAHNRVENNHLPWAIAARPIPLAMLALKRWFYVRLRRFYDYFLIT